MHQMVIVMVDLPADGAMIAMPQSQTTKRHFLHLTSEPCTLHSVGQKTFLNFDSSLSNSSLRNNSRHLQKESKLRLVNSTKQDVRVSLIFSLDRIRKGTEWGWGAVRGWKEETGDTALSSVTKQTASPWASNKPEHVPQAWDSHHHTWDDTMEPAISTKHPPGGAKLWVSLTHQGKGFFNGPINLLYCMYYDVSQWGWWW